LMQQRDVAIQQALQQEEPYLFKLSS
jgi:hypothetical protein